MWVFLSNAFLSIVVDRNDPDRLLVRGRFPDDVTAVFPEAEVLETREAESVHESLARHVFGTASH